MRLLELNPQFVRYDRRGDDIYHVYVETIVEAQGVQFLCPKCFEANHGSIGTHSICCWSSSAGTPNDATPGPGRWKLVGTRYDDLTLDSEPGKPRSVQLLSGCAWHGFITNGEVTHA